MFGLSLIAGVSFVVVLIFVVIYFLCWLVLLGFFLYYRCKGTGYQSVKFMKMMLKDNDLESTEVVFKKHILKGWNYNRKEDEIYVRLADENRQNVTDVYNMLFNFYYLFEYKTDMHRRVFWLKFMAGVIILGFIFFVLDIVFIAINSATDININLVNLIVQYFSLIGLVLMLIGWFSWTTAMENLRKELIELGEDYLDFETLKSIKKWSIVKVLCPFSENIIFIR